MIKLGHLKGGRDAFFVEADIEKLEHVADRAGPLTGRQLAVGLSITSQLRPTASVPASDKTQRRPVPTTV